MKAGRKPLTDEARDRGRRLAELLRRERDKRKQTAEELAVASGISLEVIRKLDRHETAHPGFFTVADLAKALDLDLATVDRRLRRKG